MLHHRVPRSSVEADDEAWARVGMKTSLTWSGKLVTLTLSNGYLCRVRKLKHGLARRHPSATPIPHAKGGGPAGAGPAVSTRTEMRIADGVSLFQRASQAISGYIVTFCMHAAHHLVAQHLRYVGVHPRTQPRPEVDVGTADVGTSQFDQESSGSTSGKGYSRNSMGSRGPRNTAAFPTAGMPTPPASLRFAAEGCVPTVPWD